MKEIRINLSDIPAGGLQIEEKFPKADVGVTDQDGLVIDEDVAVHAKAQLAGQTLLVKVLIDGVCSSECFRCLENAQQEFHHEVLLDFDTQNVKDSIDIAEDVRQEIVMNLPLQFLCQEDCKGLCPQCGGNLNEKQCRHNLIDG